MRCVKAQAGALRAAGALTVDKHLSLYPAGRFTKFDKAVRDRYRRSTRRVDVPELAAPVYECLIASQAVPWQTAPLSTRCVPAGWPGLGECNA